MWADKNDNSCQTDPNDPNDSCIQCEWEGDPFKASCAINPPTSTYFYYSLGYTTRDVAVQTNYPPATINGTLQNCTLQNGWCVTSPQVQITANEPVSGYQILLIEGIYNQEIFACQDNPCNFPLNNEGDNNLEYWAISSWGDTSHKSNTNVKVDTVAPNINLQVNGTMGLNNWYVTNTSLTAIGQDDTSGILEALLSVDGGTYMPSTTLSDGVYHIDVMAKDNALNTSTASATLQVDTVTPTLSLTVNGTKGDNNFYTSNTKITANTADATSGVATVQAKIDNGNWIDTTEITLSDGVHTYQFRVYDNAGNLTESPMQHIQIDSIPPAIDLTDVLDLGDTFEYHLQDDGSALAVVRIVIEDEDERFPAVIWDERLTGNKFNDDFIWDGKWADKNYASVGEYIIFVKATDRAGNESIRYGLVTVNPLSYFQPIPEFIPPVSDEITSDELTSNDESTEQNFGGTTSTNNNESTTQTLTLNISATAGTSASTSTTSTPSNILLGAVAATAIGVATAYALEQQKKRDEEEEKSKQQAKNQADQMNQAEADRKSDLWQAGQNALNYLIDKLESQGASAEDIAELREQGAGQGFGVAINNAGNAIMQNIIVNAMQADMTEEERYEAYIQTPEYIARQEALAEWQAQQDALAVQEGIHNHLMSEHQDGAVASNGGGSKPLFSPVPQDPEPPEEHNDGVSSWWDIFDGEWWESDEPWPWPFGPEQSSVSTPPSPTAMPSFTPSPTTTSIPTVTLMPSVTSTPEQPEIYAIDGPMTLDQIPQEYLCTLPEYKIINGQKLRNIYYDRCKIGEQIMVELLTNPNGWYWKDGQSKWEKEDGTIVITTWEGVKTNEDFWRLPLAYGLDTEGTTLRLYNTNGYAPLIEQAIINKFWHFDHGVSALYGTDDGRNGIPDPNDLSPLETNGRLIALGSLESLAIRIDDGLLPPKDGGSTNMWMESWNTYSNLFANEPTWIEPPATAPYEIGNKISNSDYFDMPVGENQGEVLYRSPKPDGVEYASELDIRAIVLNYQQVQYQNVLGIK